MTDMRATERLLEVIAELGVKASNALSFDDPENVAIALRALNEIGTIGVELRRRGDTLVRADDLRLAVSGSRWTAHQNSSQTKAAIDRLENALGGKML